MNNDTADPVHQQQYQDLGNRQSQEYLSEKLGKLCSQQEENHRPSQPSQPNNQHASKKQYSESQDEDEFTPGEGLNNLDLDESRTGGHDADQPQRDFVGGVGAQAPPLEQANFEGMKAQVDLSVQKQGSGLNQKVHERPLHDAFEAQQTGQNQRDQDQDHAQQKMIQPEQDRHFQQEVQSPSASDLETPDHRYGEECEDNNQENMIAAPLRKEQAPNGNAFHHEEQADQSEDEAVNGDDDSNSKLSEQQIQQAATTIAPV